MFTDWPAMIATKFATVAVIQNYKGHFDMLNKSLLKKK